MAQPTILVVGATGKTGLALVTELTRIGWPTRALVRKNDDRARKLAALGAQIALADMLDPKGMEQAMKGTKRAYWCAPFDPRALDAASLFAQLADQVGLEAIVGLSQWLASPAHPALATRNAFHTDRLFENLAPCIAYTSLNPGFFADNYLRLIGFAAQLGVLPSLTQESRNAPPSNEDIARVAAAVLADPDVHAGRSYRPTGPALLSTRDMAGILSNTLGRPVRKMEMPLWLFAKAARMQGVSASELSGFRHYVEDHRLGAFERGAPTEVVAQLTGRKAEEFATIAARYAKRPEAQRSVSSSLRAWLDFLRTPLMPAYDLRAFDADARVNTRPSMSDQTWLATHA